MITQDLGIATAYGYAKSKGYTGTEAEFAELMASYASTAQTAIEAADRAVEANTAAQSAKTDAQASKTAAQTAAQTATDKASEAVTAADAATTKASEASQSASTASNAATSASTSAQTATTAASTATTKASEAAVSATTASTAKTDAETARDAAAQSASQAAESARTLTIDDTLTQSGQAADAKVVGEKLTDLKSAFDDVTAFYDEELGIEFRPLEGTAFSTNTPYSENKIIDTPLNANKTYRIKWSIPTAISIPIYIFLSDGNGNNLITVNIPAGDTEYVRDYTPNNNYNNAYLYFTVGNVPTISVTGSVSMINVSPTRIDNLEAAVDALEDTTAKKVESRSVEITNPDTGHYINKNGGYSASNPFSISQAFNVYAGETIEVIATGYNNETAVIAQVKNNYPYIVLARSRSSVEETYTYTVLEDMSVVVSYDNRKPCTIIVKKIYDLDVIPQMQAELRDAKWKYAFDRICCIGDSLTSGAYYAGTWGGASIAQNYPNILSRMLNTTVKNSGRSGASAKTWYTNNMAGLTLSDYGTFVIWLGTNQGLTDTIATDVDPYDDYNDFADTNTGYLCRTICQIKEAVPDAHIMICTVFSTSGDLATTNDVINQVASKYALQLVDNSDLDNTNYPLYHSNAVHFNKAGNIFIADRIKNAMISYVAPDGRNAEFGLTARID